MRRNLIAFTTSLVLLLSWTTLCSFYNGEEYGKAGYYSDALQGRKTASGQAYDKDDLTCSHKTHPFGTKLRVTRMDNGKSVIVRVNDRGPFAQGFVVDISRKAAEEINLIRDGVTRVKVEVVTEEGAATGETSTPATTTPATTTAKGLPTETTPAASPKQLSTKAASTTTQLIKSKASAEPAPKPVTYSTTTNAAATPKPVATTAAHPQSVNAPVTTNTTKGAGAKDNPGELYKVDLQKAPKTGFGIQVSTLYDADNVLPIVTKLQTLFPGKVLVSAASNDATKQSTYRVFIGPYPDRATAEKQKPSVVKKGYKSCFLVDLSTL